jgi:uncharacterized heparinase superfamily protein
MMGRLALVPRLWRTVRHLRPVQIFHRLWLHVPRPLPSVAGPPPRRQRSTGWTAPAERGPSLIGPRRFRFLGREEELADIGWDGPGPDKLWRYNQHYFDDLAAAGAKARSDWHRSLIADWIAANPPGRGTGWEPYPTSIRIVNWIKSDLAGNRLSDEAVLSLAIQARWLARRLEWHLLGNHLFANAKALVFAGLFFDGPEANSWLARGRSILEREIAEQILPDGGHFELSPMYHSLALEDLLDLLNLSRAFGRADLAAAWSEPIPRMMAWLQAMTHPDGGIAFFNDSALGIAPEACELYRYAERLGFQRPAAAPAMALLRDSGYIRLSAGEFVVIGDLGPVGPDYLPGHAHADTLSFELSFADQRVFVNSGTSEYGTGPERHRQRGTAAHNTVVVAGENSSEVWAGFRVGRRARPEKVMVEDRKGTLHAEACHDGYRYLPGAPKPHRSFDLERDRFSVADSVSPGHEAEARFHLHPAIELAELTNEGAVLMLSGRAALRLGFSGGAPRLENTSWHPQFGISQPNLCLVLPLADGRSSLTVTKS